MIKEYKEVIIRICIGVILLILLIVSIIAFTKIYGNKIPKHKIDNEIVIPNIVETYTYSTLELVKDYDNIVYLDNESNELRLKTNDENLDYYIIGEYGKIYKSIVPIEKEIEETKFGNYKIYSDNDSFYYINTTNNTKSNYYVSINPLYYYNGIKDVFDFLVLKDEEKYYLLNINTDEILELDENIKDVFIENAYPFMVSNYPNYIIVENNENKYGLIDKNGNTIIDFKYDYIRNCINKDEYLVLMDDKYGIINSKDEVILNNEYDSIYYIGNYKILNKDNKYGVSYNNKIIVDTTLDNNKTDQGLYFTILNNNLLLVTQNQSYLINSKGIIRQVNASLNELSYKVNDNDIVSYLYSVIENKNNIEIKFYDLNMYEYYTLKIPYENIYDYNISITSINKNYYKVELDYDLSGDTSLDKVYYIDMVNSKEITEKDALNQYFDNGYSFVLNNNTLYIYKNNELLSTHENINDYFGGYYFSSNKNNKTSIYKIEFKNSNK